MVRPEESLVFAMPFCNKTNISTTASTKPPHACPNSPSTRQLEAPKRNPSRQNGTRTVRRIRNRSRRRAMRWIRQLADEHWPNGADHHATHAQQQTARNECSVVDSRGADGDADDAENRAEDKGDAAAIAVGDTGDEDHTGDIADPVGGA